MSSGFCKHCGTANVMVGSGEYDTTSGDETVVPSCPKCIEGCHHKMVTIGGTGWRFFLRMQQRYCERCGGHDWMYESI